MGSSPEVWPLTEPSAGGPGSLRLPGRVLTASYAAVASDSGQPLVFNSATPVTLTLPASVVSADWFIVVQNIGAGALTVARNGRTIDAAAADLAIQQNQGLLVFTDGANYLTERGVGGGGGLSGVNLQTGNYTLLGSDSGKLVVHNSSSPHDFTLPAAPPSSSWGPFIQNIGSGLLTIARNGLNIDGAAANVALLQTEGLGVSTDGSNYFTMRGWRGGSPQTVTLDAGTLAAGASATGSVSLCRLGHLSKIIASAHGRLRLYATSAGRDADASTPAGNAPAQGCGQLLEIFWLLTSPTPLTYPLFGSPTVQNGDSPQAPTIYWHATNYETGSTHLTFDLTFDVEKP